MVAVGTAHLKRTPPRYLTLPLMLATPTLRVNLAQLPRLHTPRRTGTPGTGTSPVSPVALLPSGQRFASNPLQLNPPTSTGSALVHLIHPWPPWPTSEARPRARQVSDAVPQLATGFRVAHFVPATQQPLNSTTSNLFHLSSSLSSSHSRSTRRPYQHLLAPISLLYGPGQVN